MTGSVQACLQQELAIRHRHVRRRAGSLPIESYRHTLPIAAIRLRSVALSVRAFTLSGTESSIYVKHRHAAHQ